MQECTLNDLKYLLHMPKDYEIGKRYPAIIFLHGAGSRGEDFSKLQTNPFFRITGAHKAFPFVVLAPLCTQNTWFDLWDELKELVYNTAKMPFVDANQLYLMGCSMGGYGTWQLAMSLPEYFAAIVPICGGGMYWNAGRLVNVPVWAFHGGKDQTVLVEESVKMVNKVNALGGNALLTIYPENAHDAWSDTYADYKVFQWLLSHRKMSGSDSQNEFSDAEKFG